MKKKVLGRGLGALIPEAEASAPSATELDVDQITPNPDQPRLKLDEQGLEELAASIRTNGVLQPILVRPVGEGYQLVAGERRLMAAQRAGLLKVPVVIRDVPDDRLLELALIENIQRENLNPIEESQAYQRLIVVLSLTQEELAERLGKERSTVANALRLLKLPQQVKLLLAEGKLTPGHARALLASGAGPSEMSKVAATMVERGWSVREAERWAGRAGKRANSSQPPDPNLTAATDRLRLIFGTKVEIVRDPGTRGSGTIKIRFFNPEDLDRVYGILTNKNVSQHGVTS
jgi:ParB family chromosome partitioning protein